MLNRFYAMKVVGDQLLSYKNDNILSYSFKNSIMVMYIKIWQTTWLCHIRFFFSDAKCLQIWSQNSFLELEMNN